MPGPAGWWRRQSLRARITIVTTAFFTAAVLAGSVLLVILLRTSLLRAIDESANNTAAVVRDLVLTGRLTNPIVTGNTDVQQVQVLDADQKVVAATRTADRMVGVLRPDELDRATDNRPVQVDGDRIGADAPVRVTVVSAGDYRVLVVSDLGGVVDSARILGRVAVVAGPIAVLMIGALTYWIVALTLRPVGELAAGASTITAAGLSNQRLPVQDADDEIHRLAITLNAMLDRIDVATARQRTFVGDAAHELRLPLASLRLQL